jgi:hypothetical protein
MDEEKGSTLGTNLKSVKLNGGKSVKMKYRGLLIIMCLLLTTISGCIADRNKQSMEFSENVGLTIEAEISNSDIKIIHDGIITNSEKLEITNKTEGYSLEIHLFQDDDTSEAIMSAIADEQQTITFTNLSSAHTYSIGISVDSIDEAIIISCDIND